MKKLLSALLAGVLVAASALTASAATASTAGLYTFDESDSEYWAADLTMLDKTGMAIWLEDGTAAGYNDPSYTDGTGAVLMDELTHGWYEVVLCDLGTNPEWFPADVAGKVALPVRGDSTFTVKSENAKNAGAIACLVGNNCRSAELVDEEGNVSTGTYENITMSVEYYTIPMCSLSSDVTVRLVAQTAGVSIAEAVEAVTAVFNGNLELGLEHKQGAWVYLGTEEEYKANTTRTDANTVTGEGAAAPAATATAETTTTEEAAATEASATNAVGAAYPGSGMEVPADSVLIAGEVIGSENGWDGTAASGRAAAFDGDGATFFDPATASVDWCGIDAGEEMILTKIVIRPRDNWTARFYGATIEASNDPEFNESVELFYAPEEAAEAVYIDVTDEIVADENTGYRYFRYINYMSHGDVGEVELYGKAVDGSNPTYGAAAAEEVVEEAPVVEETVVEEPVVEEAVVVEEPAVEETVEEAVTETAEEEVVEEAAQTFDFGVIAAVVAVVSAAGYAISKKR